MTKEKPAYGIRGGLAHDAGSGSFVSWDNTKCNPIASAREQARSAWEDGYASAKREWVGLTQQDIDIAFDDTQEGGGFNEFAEAIEQILRRKNT